VIEGQTRDILPAAVRAAVSDACSQYPLDQIRQWFATEGFREPDGLELGQGQMRRTLVAAIDRTIDFSSPAAARRYLRVVERVLEQLGDTSRLTSHPWASDTATKILRELRRVGIEPDQHERLELPARVGASPTLAAAPDETGIRLAIDALERPDIEPEERIGAAKDLVEATIKFGLDELGEAYGAKDDIGPLAKRLHARLRVDPSAIAPTVAGADTMVRILGGLTNIPAGLAELRNAGYGTGHGRARRISGIKDRHAELAVRAAVAYATFILDTITDPGAPWRRSTT
jgi:hypothetical protein